MAISRPTINDDDGSGTVGTIGDAAWVDDFCSRIDSAIDGANATTRAVNKGGTGVATLTDKGVLYGNGTAAIGATAVGAAGQVLTSNGAGVAPTFQAAGGGSSKPFLQWDALDNEPPASAYATPDTRNSHPVLDFDGATDEEAVFRGVLPTGYAGGGLTCELFVAFTSAITGSVRFQAAIERMDASSLDIDADSFAAFQSNGGTAPATSGQVIKIAITFTAGAQMDSLAAGEAFRLKIRRDADGTSGVDDITTDCELLRVALREP